MLPYPVLEYGDYGKRKTICCLHLRRKGLHGNGFRAYGKGLAVNALEGGIELYSILDRVSCWCCRNKNLRELNAIYHNLPQYWDKLRALQSYIEEPYKPPYTIFDLEERFAKKGRQRGLWEV